MVNHQNYNFWNIEKIRQAKGIGFVLYPNQFEEFKKFILKIKQRQAEKHVFSFEEQFNFDKGVKNNANITFKGGML